MKKAALTAVLFLCCLVPAFAGPPYQTDDPQPTGFQQWEIYLFGQMVHNGGGAFGLLPAIEINYGLLPGVQAHIISPIAISIDQAGRVNYGYGDTEFGIKLRFLGDEKSFAQLGTFPHFEISTAGAGANLGNGTLQVFFPLWVQKNWDNFTTYGGGGYWINNGNKNLNYWFFGWVLHYNFSEFAEAGIEINYNTPTVQGGNSNNSINVGVILNFTDNHHLMASVGQSITGDQTYQGYLGYQLTFGPEQGQ